MSEIVRYVVLQAPTTCRSLLTDTACIDTWEQIYGASTSQTDRSDSFFHAAGRVILNLCRLQLHVSIDALQKILGRVGKRGSDQAKERLAVEFAANRDTIADLVRETLAAVDCHSISLAKRNERQAAPSPSKHSKPTVWTSSAIAPYSSLYLFLAHVFFYACAVAMPEQQRLIIAKDLRMASDHDGPLRTREMLATSLDDAANGKPILRGGAHLLSLFDTWGCSTNLALLLHWRSKM